MHEAISEAGCLQLIVEQGKCYDMFLFSQVCVFLCPADKDKQNDFNKDKAEASQHPDVHQLDVGGAG